MKKTDSGYRFYSSNVVNTDTLAQVITDDDLEYIYQVSSQYKPFDSKGTQPDIFDPDVYSATSDEAIDVNSPDSSDDAGYFYDMFPESLPDSDSYDGYIDTASYTITQQLCNEERALQKAAQFISEVENFNFAWGEEHLYELQEFFINHPYGITFKTLVELVEHGLTPYELELATYARYIWINCDRYWISININGKRILNNKTLSWSMALRLVRMFNSHPQKEEIWHFIEKQYEFWTSSKNSQRLHKSFLNYLWARASKMSDHLPLYLDLNFEQSYFIRDEDYSDLGYSSSNEYDRQYFLFSLGL